MKRQWKTVMVTIFAAVMAPFWQTVWALNLDIDKVIPQNGLGDTIDEARARDEILRFRETGAVVCALAALTCVFLLAMSIVKLGASGGNDMQRRRAIVGIATTSTAIALLGGLGVYLGFLWEFL